jgi:hypothetical protein
MRLNRRLSVAAAILGALVVSNVAVAAGGVVGTYRTTITKSNHLNGKWALVLTKGGTYAIAQNGNILARGKYSATAKTITFFREPASGCLGSGTYAWKKSGGIMTFARKREAASCAARAEILGHRFTQVR